MSIRKRNQFLDGDDSEEENDGYDSEAVEESRGAAIHHGTKRRKVDEDSEQSSNNSEVDVSADEDARDDVDSHLLSHSTQVTGVQDGAQPDEKPATTESKSKSSSLKQAEKAQKAVRKSGVVYLSRIPPFMKPHTLRHFLEPHASKGLGRIFLTPEEHANYTKRVKNGGNKKRSFVDGWVEFTSKTEAKLAAEMLNGNIIGGKKGNFYHDDIWTMKYLSSFKWHHLTEQIANENAERAARLREEIRRTRKENKAFVEDIEKAKMLEGMESKRQSKQQSLPASTSAQLPNVSKRPARDFTQRKVQTKQTAGSDISRVLNKIF